MAIPIIFMPPFQMPNSHKYHADSGAWAREQYTTAGCRTGLMLIVLWLAEEQEYAFTEHGRLGRGPPAYRNKASFREG